MHAVDIVLEENQRLKEELAALRQIIIRADPTVMVDGRFELMIISPIAIIGIARDLVLQGTAPKPATTWPQPAYSWSPAMRRS